MAGRSYDLNKTWIAGQSRGTTVFNSSGNITIPYGRNKITVTGIGAPGNPSTPSNPASYNGASPATYNPNSVGNASSYYTPTGVSYSPPSTATYNAAGSPSNNTYNPVNCLTPVPQTGGNPAAPYTPGNCLTPTPGGCVSNYYYNAPQYNCANFATNCTPSGFVPAQTGSCVNYFYSPGPCGAPYGGGGCSGVYNQPFAGNPPYCLNGAYNAPTQGNCRYYVPPYYTNTCIDYGTPYTYYNPPSDTSWTEIQQYGNEAVIGGSGYGGCPTPYIYDPFGFGSFTYVYYTCVPVPGNAVSNPGPCVQYAYNAGFCASFNYDQGPCIQPMPGAPAEPGTCIPAGYNCTQTYVQGNCAYSNSSNPASCTQYVTNCTQFAPGPVGTCNNPLPPGCAAYNPTYNNSYNNIVPAFCSSFTGGSAAPPYTPGAPSNPLSYYPPNALTYNPPTSATYNSPVPGTPATYFPGGTPATYNPFVSGNPGSSLTVLGVYIPGGLPDNPAGYSTGVSNYWNFPDDKTYPVNVPAGTSVSIKIE